MGKYRELYQERAAIMEFDGGLPREEAEKKALIEVKWLWIEEMEIDLKKAQSYSEIRKFEHEMRSA